MNFRNRPLCSGSAEITAGFIFLVSHTPICGLEPGGPKVKGAFPCYVLKQLPDLGRHNATLNPSSISTRCFSCSLRTTRSSERSRASSACSSLISAPQPAREPTKLAARQSLFQCPSCPSYRNGHFRRRLLLSEAIT